MVCTPSDIEHWLGNEAPPDIKLMLLCVQAVTAKGHPKFRKTREGKNSYKSVTHTKIKIQIYESSSLVPRAIISDLAVSFPELSRRPQKSFPNLTSNPRG